MCVNAIDTMESLDINAKALQSVYKLQTAVINNSLNYDCVSTDKNGLCFSVGGRYNTTDAPSGESSGALLVGANRINDHLRIGIYLDENLTSSLPGGLNMERRTPLMGVFGNWQDKTDGRGAQIRLAAGYHSADLNVTRSEKADPFTQSEAASGRTRLSSQAASLVGSYGIALQGSWLASPYLGIRHSQIKAAGYTENTPGMQSPLTYAPLALKSTTLLAGLRLNGNISNDLTLNGSLGLEHDLSSNNPSYDASGLIGLTPIVFIGKKNGTRPVANLGASYKLGSSQSIGMAVIYRQEVFKYSDSTSAYLTYTIAF